METGILDEPRFERLAKPKRRNQYDPAVIERHKERLRARPGKWAVIARYRQDGSTVTRLRRRFGEDFETRQVTREDGIVEVRVRYIGGAT